MRILMVDRDQDFLQATRKAFWQSHRGWEVLLAQHREEALNILARDSVDIIVVDMHLPDTDCAELIQSVKGLRPIAVRIALVDQGTLEDLGDTEEALHRIFIRPLDPAFLIGVIESLDIADDDESLRALHAFVAGLGRVPSLPRIYSELVELLKREDAGLGEIARLIRRDLGIASQVLKLANSVHWASDRPVTEIGQAVAMLGMDTLRAVVLFRSVIAGCGASRPQGLDLEKLWHHSFQVATGVRKLAVLEGETQLADLAFSVGLLHDLGLLVLATEPSGEYQAVLEKAQSTHMPLSVLEHQAFGVDHAQIGAHLLSLWGLPPAFCRPVREHHAPPAEPDRFSLSGALHLSDAKHGGGDSAGMFADGRWGLHPNILLDPQRLARWKACLAMDQGAPKA